MYVRYSTYDQIPLQLQLTKDTKSTLNLFNSCCDDDDDNNDEIVCFMAYVDRL